MLYFTCVKKRITAKQIEKMQTDVWAFYEERGRSGLLWRRSVTPYQVVVSEIMLQQTQVARVEEYFRSWMKKFPNWQALANAALREVLLSWQGLGYNRRGKYLHDIAKVVDQEYQGILPKDPKDLEALPGIGPYTRGAIRAFAFNEMDLFLETNIRTVLLYHLYPGKGGPTSRRSGTTEVSRTLERRVDEKELLEVLRRYIAQDQRAQNNPREFYYALMDYGAYLKKEVGNLNKQSKTYTKQSRFEGSRRELRAHILRYVLHHGPISEQKILDQSNRDSELVQELLGELVKEGSVAKKRDRYFC